MQNVLLVIELIVAAALIVVVLLQKSEGGALGMGGGGGSMGGLFTPRGAGDALSKTTGYLAFVFFAVCIALNLYALHGSNSGSILRDSPAAPAKQTTVPIVPAPAPASPQVPKPN
jgi:preprotein translocase subunit SecG